MNSSRQCRLAKTEANRRLQEFLGEPEEELDLDVILDEEENADDDEIHEIEEEDDAACVSDSDDDVIARDAVTDLSASSDEEPDHEEDSSGLHSSSNGLQWHDNPFVTTGRVRQENILRENPGPKRGLHPTSEREAFLIFVDDVIDDAVHYTNLQGRRIVQKFNRGQRRRRKVWHDVSRDEMEAFIGLNMILGAYKAHYRNIHELFTEMHGHPICKATMSKERFCQIKRMFRVDDKLRRDLSDVLAPLGRTVEILTRKFQESFTASSHLTIDEQLMEFHGKVKIKQYISTKPGKFGIKIFWICDAIYSYAFLPIIYAGEQTLSRSDRESASSFSEALVCQMTKPWHGSGRGVVMHNWFTSIPLAEKTLTKNMTILGTLRQCRKGIPTLAKSPVGRERKSALSTEAT